MESSAIDQSGGKTFSRQLCASFESRRNLVRREPSNVARDKTRAKIAVRLIHICWTTDDQGMIRQIDRVGNDGCGRIGLCGSPRQDCHCVGDP